MKLTQPQAIRTIFFDAGYTLLYPFPSIPEVCQRICQDVGLHIQVEQVKGRMEDTAEDFYFRQLRVDRNTWANEDAITAFWIDYYMNLLYPFVDEHNGGSIYRLAHSIHEEFTKHSSWNIYPDVLPTLETLHAHGYSLGIISDWGMALGPIIRQHQLTRYFSCLLISAAAGHAKPSPTLFELALQRTNAVPDFSIHIGDSYIHDVLGARAMGITPIMLDRNYKYSGKKLDCLCAHSLYDLLHLLEIEPCVQKV
jgi:HAD superfamily hydrolase (TIGR01549 family)